MVSRKGQLLALGLVLLFAVGCGGGGGGSSTLSDTMAVQPVSAPTTTVVATPAADPTLTPIQSLGEQIFNDTTLSDPPGQACVTCHQPTAAFSDPRPGQPTSQGAIGGVFGFRNAPSIMYAKFIPPRTADSSGDSTGGLFLDGRVDTLVQQAEQPFLNTFEMGDASEAEVVGKVQTAAYSALFQQVFGTTAFADTTQAYEDIATALAAYEQGPEFALFSSKYDRFLAGQATLTTTEQRGLDLFNTDVAHGGGNCISCHPSTPGPNGQPPLFTDFSYDDIGVPRNASNPFLNDASQFNPAGQSFSDTGLQDTTNNVSDQGRFRVQSLRNIAVTAPYFHNGEFATLQEVVHFYNVKNSQQSAFPAEFPGNMNNLELGSLGLSSDDEAAIVAFLNTLTDGQ